MNETDFLNLVEEDRVDLGTPPVDAILREAREAVRRRRRRAATVLLAAASVVAAVGAVSLLSGSAGDDPDRPEVVQPSRPLIAPDGMRYVGFEEFAIAVPEEWGTNEFGGGVPCSGGEPIEPSVVFGSGGRDCAVSWRMPMLRIDRDAHWDEGDGAWQQREVDGIPILVSGPSLSKDGFEELEVGIEGTDTILTIRTRTLVEGVPSHLTDDILETLTRIPEGQVAVPDAWGLNAVDLHVEVTRRQSGTHSYGYVLDQDPVEGTIVQVDSAVHVVVDGLLTDPVAPKTWEAAGFHLRAPGAPAASTLYADEALRAAGINAHPLQTVFVRLTVDDRPDVRNRLVYLFVSRVWKPDLSEKPSRSVPGWATVVQVVDAHTGERILSRSL